MKLKENLELSTTDFWYDLTDGGYLKPTLICKDLIEADKLLEAIALIKEFENSCEEQIEGFIQ